MEVRKKWMIFVDSIVYGKQLEKTLKDKLECDSIIFITTDYKKRCRRYKRGR